MFVQRETTSTSDTLAKPSNGLIFFGFVIRPPKSVLNSGPPCRPPRKSSRPPESLQKTRYATSRNPRKGAVILAVPRSNLLARPVAATHLEGFGWPRALSRQ